MPTLTPITLRSENPKYNHTITVAVDNDLTSTSTIVVPGTFFPYLVEFTGYTGVEGKRYISEWLYKKLTETAYTTSLGRVLFSLKKDISCIPYYKLDYASFRDMVTSIKKSQIVVDTEAGPRPINELEYLGSAIADFDRITPEYLLKWLDFPTKDGNGEPVEKFPILVDYSATQVLAVDLLIVGYKSTDFYQAVYLAIITHALQSPIIFYTADSYNKILSQYNFETGEYSRPVTYQKIQNASQQQSLDRMLSTALNPNLKSLLPNTNLAAAASAVTDKLNQLKALGTSLPKLPKLPRINLSKIVVDLKVKFKGKKNIKRVRKSESFNFSILEKPKIPSSLSNAAKALKTAQTAGQSLAAKAASAKSLAESKLTSITNKLDSLPIG